MSFPILLGVKNACNWAIHGCTCASAEPAVMSVAVISHPIDTQRSIFMQLVTQSSKAMIRPKAGAGVMLTNCCLTCRIDPRRNEVRSPGFIDALQCAARPVDARCFPAFGLTAVKVDNRSSGHRRLRKQRVPWLGGVGRLSTSCADEGGAFPPCRGRGPERGSGWMT